MGWWWQLLLVVKTEVEVPNSELQLRYLHVMSSVTEHVNLDLDIFQISITIFFPILTVVKNTLKITLLRVVIYHCKKLPFVVEKCYNFFPTLTDVKTLGKFTAIIVVINSSNFYYKNYLLWWNFFALQKVGFCITILCVAFLTLPP